MGESASDTLAGVASTPLASRSFSSDSSASISGTNSINPSGTSTTPCIFPAAARSSTTATSSFVMDARFCLRAATSSPSRVTLGWVARAHSRAMLLAARPIKRMNW